MWPPWLLQGLFQVQQYQGPREGAHGGEAVPVFILQQAILPKIEPEAALDKETPAKEPWWQLTLKALDPQDINQKSKSSEALL